MAYRANLNSIKFKRSFTLLESIVAIYVLLFGLVSAMSLTQQSLATVSHFKKTLIASNLAQEGIEFVRNKRDSNYITARRGGCELPACNPNDSDWDGLIVVGGQCDLANGCYVDIKSRADLNNEALNFQPCGGPGVCQAIRIDDNTAVADDTAGEATGIYGYLNQWSDTGFDRRILIDYPIDSGAHQDARVRSIVTWADKFSSKQFIILETYLTPHLE